MRVPVATVVLVGVLALGAGCGGSKGDPNVAPEPKGDDAELVEGRGVYVANCQKCHGAQGQGLAGSRLADVMTKRFPNIENQIEVVTNGAANGAMPAWGGLLTPEEIRAVVRYTREVL